jgi:transposase-like protein
MRVKAAVDTMGLDEREEVMEIVTSWEQRAIERVAVNLLREGMAIEAIARVTGLSVEQVLSLQAHMAETIAIQELQP